MTNLPPNKYFERLNQLIKETDIFRHFHVQIQGAVSKDAYEEMSNRSEAYHSKQRAATEYEKVETKAIIDSLSESKEKSETFQTRSGEKIFLGRSLRIVHPALDYVNETLMVIRPFPTEKPVFDRKGNIIGTKPSIDNFVVASSREVISCTDTEFNRMDLLPSFPSGLVEERWSRESVRSFLESGETVNPVEVFTNIKDTWDFFMDFGSSPGAYVAHSLYVVLTYCFPIFGSIPYMRFTGLKGAAKSKAGSIYEGMSFNALNSVNMTPAVMFRSIEGARSTLIIDEAEEYGKRGQKSEIQEANSQVVNAGWQSQGKVIRIEGQAKRVPVPYSAYGPKVICGINEVTETLRDRSYETVLVKTLDHAKSRREARSTDPRFQEIRDQLYLLVMNHWKEVLEIYEKSELQNRLNLLGREWDKARPLIVLAKFFDSHSEDKGSKIEDELWTFLEDQRSKEEEISADSFEASIVNVLEDMIRPQLDSVLPEFRDGAQVEVPLMEFALRIATTEGMNTESDRFRKRSYQKRVKDKLKRMGLAVEFRTGTGNWLQFKTSMELVKTAKERYRINNNGDVANLSNSSNFANSSNSSNSKELGKLGSDHDDNFLPNSSIKQNNTDSKEDSVSKVRKVSNMDEGEVKKSGTKNRHSGIKESSEIENRNRVLLQRYCIIKQFSEGGLLYSESQEYDWNPEDSGIKKWIREGKIAPLREKPILRKEGDPDFCRVEVQSNIDVAGKLGDYRLRKGQIIYIEKEQLPTLLKRGAVREIQEGENP